MYAVDHVFILCSQGAPEAAGLLAAGLVEGSGNSHPGQGTACRRFFFHNAYLELLWVEDPRQAASAATWRTRLLERWTDRGQGASPFGIALRPEVAGTPVEPPFATWPYTPRYLPDGWSLAMASDVPLSEPQMFFMAFAQRPDAPFAPVRQSLEHPLGVQELTGVTIRVPYEDPWSPAARALATLGLVSWERGGEDLMELRFDGVEAGRSIDLRPGLPLVLRVPDR